MTNHNTNWRTMVSVREGPQDMHYRGDFCCGAYATVIVKNYTSTDASSPDSHIQAGELVTIDYDNNISNLLMESIFAAYPPYHDGADEDYLTARPVRTPDTTVETVVPKVRYITAHPTTAQPNIVGVVLVDPFQVDPDNLEGNGPTGSDVWITHIALRGFCLVKDRRNVSGGNTGGGLQSFYYPGRLIGIDATGETYSGKNNGQKVYSMTNIMDNNRQTTSYAEAVIGVYHRVVAWGGTARNLGHRAGFPGGGSGTYQGQDILLIYLNGGLDTGYAL